VAAVEPPADQPGAQSLGPAGAGILDLYRSVWQVARAAIIRYRIAIVVEIVLIVAWFVLRTEFSVESRAYLVWTIVAAGVALISPTSGLVILVATAPFFEPVSLSRVLGMRHVLVAVLGISVLLRLILGGWRRMPWPAPVRLAIGVTVVTLLGVANTWRHFSTDWATVATQTWLSSIGGAMVLLLVAVWVAATGSKRFWVAAVVSTTIAVGLSLIENLSPGSVSNGAFAWIGFWKDFGPRLGGAIPSPNGMAALAVMPVCVLSAVAIFGQRRELRLIASIGAGVLFVAMYVTYSRAAIISLFGLAVVVTWRLNRRLGQLVFVAGIVVGILLLPTYLQLREGAGSQGALEPGSLLVASDRDRITGWQAAIGMVQNRPLTGQGFLAYKQLADAFGDPVLGSPHNEWLRFFAEEGVIGGIIGLCFAATTLAWLIHGRDAIATGIVAGTVGYFTMASFNNPLLFIQVSSVVYPLIALVVVAVWEARRHPSSDPSAATTGEDRVDGEAVPVSVTRTESVPIHVGRP
jgi:hypothetical protein